MTAIETHAAKTGLTGRVERVTFHNPDTHFTVARLRICGPGGVVTIVGTLPDPAVGETLRVDGHWEQHPRFGQQLHIDRAEVVLPDSVDGIRAYLASGLISGIGPKTAGRLVDHFGRETLSVIESHPQRLMDVEGIGEAKADTIAAAWREHHAARELLSFLQAIGVKPSYGPRLLRCYGPEAVAIMTDDPFRLIEDLPGIGFPIADAIIRHLNLPVDAAERSRACIVHLLQQDVDAGHTHTPIDDLIDRCGRLFAIDVPTVTASVDYLRQDGELVVDVIADAETPVVFLKRLHMAEERIADRLSAVATLPPPDPDLDPTAAAGKVLRRLAVALSDEQLAVVKGVFSHRVVIVTGGPGTGKTTLIRAICAVLEDDARQIRLAAPTGRAARRLAAITGRETATLHRLLGYLPSEDRFSRCPQNPIDTDAVIVDEASMVDTLLMDALLQALPATTMLMLVGDAFQLPSVGAGSVLADLIRSGRIPVYRLTQIFRQVTESRIIANAHRIRSGGMPDIPEPVDADETGDFHFIAASGAEGAAHTVVELCARSIPDHFGFDPIQEIQVLTPMHKGNAGTIHLNARLQQALNPNPTLFDRKGLQLKCGDKVMHLRNNYAKDVFNGDIGQVTDIDTRHRLVVVSFDGRPVEYDDAEIDELSLAYAISVHKSQGSEYPAVVVPLVNQHYAMLQRNLLYTAVTRASRLVVLVGSRRALGLALERDNPQLRRTRLAERLMGRRGITHPG